MIGLLAVTLAALPAQDMVYGRWEGAVVYRGVPWEMRLDIPEENLPVRLDLPELLYEREPINADLEDDEIWVEMPFGLGRTHLTVAQDRLVGEIDLGDRKAQVLLDRRTAPWPFAERQVDIPVEGAVLKGTLVLPSGEGPHPAAVVVHGASQAGRSSWSYRSHAYHLARKGFAALIYEKRDQQADLAVLAADARRAFEFLSAQSGVNPRGVGFTGGSQAGWLISDACKHVDPAFLLLSACPADTPRETELYAITAQVGRAGGDPDAQSYSRTYMSLFFAAALTGRHVEAVQREADLLPDHPWTKILPIPAGYEELQWWKANANFGQEGMWRGIDCPVLSLHGANDVVVPPGQSADGIRRLVTTYGKGRVETHIFPGADHRVESPAGVIAGRWRWPAMAPGYFEVIDEWLDRVKSLIQHDAEDF